MLLPRVVRYFSLVCVCSFFGLTVLFRSAPPVSAQNPPPPAPAFLNYAAPEDCSATHPPPNCIQPSVGSTTAGGHGAGEPSIGVDWSSGKAFIEAGNHTLRVTFNDTVNPATATWEDKRSPFARVSLDPILFTDDGHFGGRNRTFSSQLNLATIPALTTRARTGRPRGGRASPPASITRR